LDIIDEGLTTIRTAIPKEWKSVTIKTKANIIKKNGSKTQIITNKGFE
jgi:hypothetical protein